MSDPNDSFDSYQFRKAMEKGDSARSGPGSKRLYLFLGLAAPALLWAITWDGKDSEVPPPGPTTNPVALKRAQQQSKAPKPTPRKKATTWPSFPPDQIPEWNPFSAEGSQHADTIGQLPNSEINTEANTLPETEQTSKEEKALTTGRVTAILTSGKHRSAIIDGKVVQIGDLIGGQKILEIRKDRVIMEPRQLSQETVAPAF